VGAAARAVVVRAGREVEQRGPGPRPAVEADVVDLEVRAPALRSLVMWLMEGGKLCCVLDQRRDECGGLGARVVSSCSVCVHTCSERACRSMLAIGLSWKQALPAIAVGHTIIAVVMVRTRLLSSAQSLTLP
jgi:hypothetical protein